MQKDEPSDIGLSNLIQPSFTTQAYGFNSLSYLGSKYWNVLPNEYKECATLSHFKSKISQWQGPLCNCNTCFTCIFKV